VSLLHGDGKVSPNAKRDEEILARRHLGLVPDDFLQALMKLPWCLCGYA